jgi:gliding motility-associated-like protein
MRNVVLGRQMILLLAGLAAHATTTFAQTPGGVSGSLSSWFKANTAVAANIDTPGSASVAAWKSELGNYQVSQTTVSRQPVLEATNTQTGNFNFNPFIQFSKTNNTVLFNTTTTPDLLGANGSVFMVVNTFNSVPDGNPSGLTYQSTNFAFQIKPGFRVQTGDGIAGGTGDYYNWAPWPSGTPGYATESGIILMGKGVDQSSADRNFSARRNGDSIAVSHRYNLPNDGYSYTPIIPTGLFFGSDGSSAGGQNMSCGLAEVITYNTYLSEADHNKVETYLAIKYGITLTQGMSVINRDYTAADGTVIWNAAANTGYLFNITGIGRDDSSALYQKQSRSVHNGSMLYLYNGSVQSGFPDANKANTTSIGDKSFLIFGDNGLSKQLATCTNKMTRIARIWKVQKTGTGISQVTLAIDQDSLVAGVKGIIVSPDPGFPESSTTFYPLSQAAGKFFAECTLTDNVYFSFSTDTLKAVLNSVAPDCLNATGGSITTTVSGGLTPYDYTWSTGASTGGLSNVGAGTYTITIADSLCQSITATVTLLSPTPPAAPLANGMAVCPGDVANLTVQNPNTAYTYNWYTVGAGGTAQGTGASYPVTVTTLPETWYVDLQFGSCISARTPVQLTQAVPLPQADIKATNVTTNSITFTWQPVPNATGYLVSINGGAFIVPTSGSTGTVHVVVALDPVQTITIKVIAQGVNGCQNSEAQKTATTLPDEIFIPNTFTPNGDGKNETFKVYGHVIEHMVMKVFNQWGQLIYESSDLSTGWDGRHKGKMQPMGVYFYAIRLQLKDGSEVTRKGSVNLLH